MRFEIPEQKTLVHEGVFPIRWGDMDLMGHVNNTVYFRYMEISRVDWLHSLGGPPNPGGSGPVVANVFCNFIKQLVYPGDVIARHYVANLGRSSFDTYVTMTRTDDPETLYAVGGGTMVWLDFPTKKSVPVPDALRALFG